jgi:hypothetical protein
MKAKNLPTQNSKDSCNRNFYNSPKTRVNKSSWFTLLFAILLGTGLIINTDQAYGQCNSNDPSVPVGIVPTVTPQGNPPLCSGGVRLNSPTSGTYALGGGTVTITLSNSSCGQVFSWSASPGVEIHEIIAKGGPVANLYDYKTKNPRPTSDGYLHSPVGPSGNYYGLSHIDFCFTYTPPPPVCQIKIEHEITCPGGKDGAASVSASGGKAPYSFVWKDESNNTVGSGTSVSGLTAGIYTVTVTDADGRKSECQVELEDGTAILECYVVVEEQPVFGVGYGVATVYVTINGVLSDLEYEYKWFPSGETTKTSTMVTNSGGYVKVKHANGCVTECEIPIETGCVDLEVTLDCQTEELKLDEGTVIAYAQAKYDKMLEDEEFEVEVTVLSAEVFKARTETGDCMWEEIWVISAKDALGNIGNCNIKISWKEDLEAPVITADGKGGDLDCNPTAEEIEAALGSATAGDNCDDEVEVKVANASGNNGCYYWATRTFTAVDECGNEADEVVVRVTWKVDEEAPVITADGEGGDLGCNPSEAEIEAALGSATAEDNCDAEVEVKVANASGNEGCNYWATRTFTAVDKCGNEADEVVVRVIWKVDEEAPVITADGKGGDLDCNPTAEEIEAALGSATAGDNCDDKVEVKVANASGNEGCYYWATRTFTAVDECGNEADEVVVRVTWKVDVDGPVLQGELVDLIFACDADVVLPNPVFTDKCDGGVTYTYTVGGVASGDLDELYEFPEGDTQVCFTAVDACGNTTVKCIIVTVEPCVYECETAYAKGNGSVCFLPTFSQWGWTNAITPGSYVFDLWAAAGQCDTGKGTRVGTVNIVYGPNGHVSVTYNVIPPFKIEETHTYVGTTKFPQVKRGRTTTSTVAPGSYYYAGPFKNGQQVYVIAHAVVCGPFTTTKVSSVTQKSAVIERLDNATELKVYPNPFNSRVAFEFVSSKDVNARLEIYNNIGQRISTLMDRPVEKGVLNRVEFTPSNITHGVLFYRLLLDDEVQNGKLLYTK